jgi:hypothetical protein
MDKVQEYRRRAAECRRLSTQASVSDLRKHYESLAEIWEKLAEERLAFFVTTPHNTKDERISKK